MTVCQSCGSQNVKKNGTKTYSNSITKQRYLCKDCKHSFFHTSTPIVIDEAGSTHYGMPASSSSSSPAIATVYMTGNKKSSHTLVIPQSLAKKSGLHASTKVVVRETDKGLLISKLEV
jgi:hypothetical protein